MTPTQSVIHQFATKNNPDKSAEIEDLLNKGIDFKIGRLSVYHHPLQCSCPKCDKHFKECECGYCDEHKTAWNNREQMRIIDEYMPPYKAIEDNPPRTTINRPSVNQSSLYAKPDSKALY